MPTKLNTEILAAAIVGFEEQKKRIDAHIAELRKNGAGPHSEEHPRGSHFHFFGQKRADKKSRRAGLIGAGLVEIRGGGKQ